MNRIIIIIYCTIDLCVSLPAAEANTRAVSFLLMTGHNGHNGHLLTGHNGHLLAMHAAHTLTSSDNGVGGGGGGDWVVITGGEG